MFELHARRTQGSWIYYHHCKQCKIEVNSTRPQKTGSYPAEPRLSSYCGLKEQSASQVSLVTPTIKFTGSLGTQQPCRILLYGGSQSIYINEELAQRLQLKRRCNEMPITGINNTCSAVTHTLNIMFSCKDNKYSNVVTWFILPNMTGNMSSSTPVGGIIHSF
jgi:hypothetical protein